jgi:hypothetical protein
MEIQVFADQRIIQTAIHAGDDIRNIYANLGSGTGTWQQPGTVI